MKGIHKIGKVQEIKVVKHGRPRKGKEGTSERRKEGKLVTD